MTEQELFEKYLGWTPERYKAESKHRGQNSAYENAKRDLVNKVKADESLSDKDRYDNYHALGLRDVTGRSGLAKLTDGLGLTNEGGRIDAQKGAQYEIEEINNETQDQYKELADVLGGNEQITAFREAVNAFNPDDFTVDITPLTSYRYNKTLDQFMDPAADFKINKSVQAAQNAMAGQGGLSGGAAARQLQAVASEAASDEYGSAWDRMMKDQEMDYGKTKDLITAQMQAAGQNLEAQNAGISNLKGASDDVINTMLTAMLSDSNMRQLLAQMGVDSVSGGVFGDILNGVKTGSEIYSNFKG